MEVIGSGLSLISFCWAGFSVRSILATIERRSSKGIVSEQVSCVRCLLVLSNTLLHFPTFNVLMSCTENPYPDGCSSANLSMCKINFRICCAAHIGRRIDSRFALCSCFRSCFSGRVSGLTRFRSLLRVFPSVHSTFWALMFSQYIVEVRTTCFFNYAFPQDIRPHVFMRVLVNP